MKFSEMLSRSDEGIGVSDTGTDFEVNKLCYDSNLVEEGDVFFAIKGVKTDGNKYINNAIGRGAKAVISDSGDTAESINGVSIYRVQDCRKAMAALSNSFYGFPSHKMRITGITGTNGKTTVASLINFVLEFWDKKTGLISTNGNYINKRYIKTEFTTPESVELNGLLSDMCDSGVEYATIEVSSHSLALSRVYGIDFDVAVFTNLTPEHLDFHENMEKYFEAKKSLFNRLERINAKGNNTATVYNSDDEHGSRIVSGTEAERISYGFQKSAFSVDKLKMDFGGMHFDMIAPSNSRGTDKVKIETRLTGRFNTYNILASSAALNALRVPLEVIQEGIKNFPAVEGRFNVLNLANGAAAIIDYSHTPDALLQALKSIEEIMSSSGRKGNIITVFGCGGNRDRLKRPLMGQIASAHSYHSIITSDNPRFEDPMDIIEEIKKGIPGDNYSVEENREKAIGNAVKLSKKNDVILVAGKGHETYQEIMGAKHHFSDREIVERFI